MRNATLISPERPPTADQENPRRRCPGGERTEFAKTFVDAMGDLAPPISVGIWLKFFLRSEWPWLPPGWSR